MQETIRNIYQVRACMHVQTVMSVLFVMEYIKVQRIRHRADCTVKNMQNIIFCTLLSLLRAKLRHDENTGGSVLSTQNLNNGKYQARYKTGIAAEVNTIEAEGNAAITVPEVYYDPFDNKAVTEDYPAETLPQRSVDLKSGQEILFDRDTGQPILTGSQKTVYTVYGVDVSMTTPLSAVFIDNINEIGYGYSLNDLNVSYTIEPPGYQAAGAYVGLWEDDLLINLISSETTGAGSAIFAEGFQFNPDKKYEVQVILNFGGANEIRSDKVIVPVGYFRMVTDDDQTPVNGVVTDGTAKIRLQLTVKYGREAFEGLNWQVIDTEVNEWTPSAIRGSLMDGENPVESVPVVFNGEIAEAVYRAPESFVRWGEFEEDNDKEQPYRYIQPTLDISAYFENGEDPLTQIRLRRTPVVLVHGLWGDGRRNSKDYSWKEFEPEFNKKELYNIVSVDYHETNASSLVTNAKIIKDKGIDKALEASRSQKLAAIKADIIGNSMGGLLPREFCRNNPIECNKRIHKLITTDTPHLGSELATLINEVNDQPTSKCYNLLKQVHATGKSIWSNSGSNILNGALIDLAVGSPALNSLPDITFKTVVGSTPGNVLAYDVSLNKMWKGLFYYCGYGPDDSYTVPFPYPFYPLFLGQNDRIVSVNSQKGSSVENYILYSVDHLTVLEEQNVATKIKEWLDIPW